MVKRFYLRHAVPVTVWLVAVGGGGLAVLSAGAAVSRPSGIARGQVRQVAAMHRPHQGNPVALFQPVKAGQTLAVVDTVADSELVDEAELRTEMATAAAEAERLLAAADPHAGAVAWRSRQTPDEPRGQLAAVRGGCG